MGKNEKLGRSKNNVFWLFFFGFWTFRPLKVHFSELMY